MQEGDYTFQLTVTDSAGQQDTAHVTVIVQPGRSGRGSVGKSILPSKKIYLFIYFLLPAYQLIQLCTSVPCK